MHVCVCVVSGDSFHRQCWISAADARRIRPEWSRCNSVGMCGDGWPADVECIERRTAAQQLDVC